MNIKKGEIATGVPIMMAEEFDGQLHVWCSFCAKYHHHGLDSNNQMVIAHCINPYSPYKKSNYFIKRRNQIKDPFDTKSFAQDEYVQLDKDSISFSNSEY